MHAFNFNIGRQRQGNYLKLKASANKQDQNQHTHTPQILLYCWVLLEPGCLAIEQGVIAVLYCLLSAYVTPNYTVHVVAKCY